MLHTIKVTLLAVIDSSYTTLLPTLILIESVNFDSTIPIAVAYQSYR